MRDGFRFLANRRVWNGAPPRFQEILARNINGEAIRQRAEVEQSNANLQSDFRSKGTEVFTVNDADVRRCLDYGRGSTRTGASADGDEAWLLLEAAVGRLGWPRVAPSATTARPARLAAPSN